MSSLAELREIEQERVKAERAALVAAEETRSRDVELAAQRIRDHEARRVQTERDAALALEQARLGVEREIRMRAEVAEAAERARHQAGLDEQRFAQEMELRRAEVARKRPTWMLAVTAFAVLACVGSSAFAVERQQAANDALAAKGVSDRDRAAARVEAADARKNLEAMKVTLSELEGRVTVALAANKKAQDAKDLAAQDDRLRKINADIAAAKKRDDDQKLEDWKKKRGEKVVIDPECLHNAWTKKCQPK